MRVFLFNNQTKRAGNLLRILWWWISGLVIRGLVICD